MISTLTAVVLGAVILTNAPVGYKEIPGNRQILHDLGEAQSIVMQSYTVTPGPAGARLRIQFSVSGGPWISSSCATAIDIVGYSACGDALSQDVKSNNVRIRVVSQGGDGVADPKVANVFIGLRYEVQ